MVNAQLNKIEKITGKIIKKERGRPFLTQKCSIPVITTHNKACNCGCQKGKNRLFHRRQFVVKENVSSIPTYNICGDPRVQLRLTGLNGNFNFQLFRYKGCRIKATVESAMSIQEIQGVVCNVGTNFVDIKREDGKIITIPQEKITRIEWLDPDCGPCTNSDAEIYNADYDEMEE
jgi:hypothetical protein